MSTQSGQNAGHALIVGDSEGDRRITRLCFLATVLALVGPVLIERQSRGA
ncbi:MAG: hypothetical protein KDA32_11095 [Phycisphaerales bacterium]|nr:hypothetical protein [Phycisphaerales bacterium]